MSRDLAQRIADGYDIDIVEVRKAIDATPGIPRHHHEHALERRGGDILLVAGGDIAAVLDLSDLLPGIAPACDTLDPYGDEDHSLTVRDIVAPLGSHA